MPVDITGLPYSLGEISTGTWTSRVGESQISDNKIWSVLRDSTKERRCEQGSATAVNYRPDLSSERALHINKPINV
jgi:hypothetical protein